MMGLQVKNVDPSGGGEKEGMKEGANEGDFFHVRSVEGRKVDGYLRRGWRTKQNSAQRNTGGRWEKTRRG